MTPVKTYRDLIVWQEAHAFVLQVYAITKLFPSEEKFGLTSQLRRAAVSVPSNIVEGFSRWTNLEKVRFYNISESSLAEADYQLLLAHDLGYSDTTVIRQQGDKLKAKLLNFIKSIRVE